MNPTILIAEDDTRISNLFQEFLLFQGYQVETASGGLDCVEKLRRLKPNVLVLDPEIHWRGQEGTTSWLRMECANDGVAVVMADKGSFSPHGPPDAEPLGEKIQALPSCALTALEERVRTAIACKGPREPEQVDDLSDCPERLVS